MTDRAELRRQYMQEGLEAAAAGGDPLDLFGRWFAAARAAELYQPNVMTVATVAPDGAPAARAIICAGFGVRGFTFYTIVESRKGRELVDNPRVALLFTWAELERQVRIEGRVEPVPAEEADAYWQGRPPAARLAVSTARQSEVVPDRAVLERRLAALAAEFPFGDVPRPPYYGGYRVVPAAYEFWQGRPDRLHDRLRYELAADGWRVERLAP